MVPHIPALLFCFAISASFGPAVVELLVLMPAPADAVDQRLLKASPEAGLAAPVLGLFPPKGDGDGLLKDGVVFVVVVDACGDCTEVK